jgi:hypothetical protein
MSKKRIIIANFHTSTSKRDVFSHISHATTDKIGPGAYNSDKMPVFPLYKYQQSSVFSS